MKNPFIWIALCVTLFVLASCGSISSLLPENSQGSVEEVTIHVTINDVIIEAGDAYDVIDPAWWTADIYGSWRDYEDSLQDFSQEQRYLIAVIWHEAEVFNGGHDQFYWNSTGIVWQDALAGYKAIGLEEAAMILEESASLMGGDPSVNRLERQAQLDRLEPDFAALDRRFYALQETVDFNEVMMAYIRLHREAFYFDGEVTKYVFPNQEQ